MEEEIKFSDNLIFKYGSVDHLRDTLIHNTIGFSKPASFNDPFEIAHKFMSSVSDETYEQNREFLQNAEISCFSRTSIEPLMWSHYAEKHQGVCYIFDELELVTFGLCSSFNDVTYSNHFPSIYDSFQRELNKVIYTKSLNWAYEKEYRIILKPGQEKKFKKSSLRGIILGYRASIDYEKHILDIVKEANKNRKDKIKVYYANLSTHKYEMFITEKPTRIVAENIRVVNYRKENA